MPTEPQKHIASAHPSEANDYDALAVAYTAENETGIQNAYYERPAMLALAGEVSGRRILDAGCGSGPLFAELRGRGSGPTRCSPCGGGGHSTPCRAP